MYNIILLFPPINYFLNRLLPVLIQITPKLRQVYKFEQRSNLVRLEKTSCIHKNKFYLL
jgi:hypothetical protein